jgi:hypothetical protein
VRKRMGHAYKNTSFLAPRFTFALRMTRAPSRNVGKFYRTVKLSAENLRFVSYMISPAIVRVMSLRCHVTCKIQDPQALLLEEHSALLI